MASARTSIFGAPKTRTSPKLGSLYHDEHNKILTFTIPASLTSSSQSRTTPSSQSNHSSLLALPYEIFSQILIHLHPVDRICLALSSHSLLQTTFSDPSRTPIPGAWSYHLTPSTSTASPLKPRTPILFAALSGHHIPIYHPPASSPSSACSATSRPQSFIFSFTCPHPPSIFTWGWPSCSICNQLHSYHGVRSLMRQLVRGWGGLPASKWRYCDSCRCLRPRAAEAWGRNAAWQAIVEGRIVKEDLGHGGVLQAAVGERGWKVMSREQRLSWILRMWGTGDPTNRQMQYGVVLELCPICVVAELERGSAGAWGGENEGRKAAKDHTDDTVAVPVESMKDKKAKRRWWDLRWQAHRQ